MFPSQRTTALSSPILFSPIHLGMLLPASISFPGPHPLLSLCPPPPNPRQTRIRTSEAPPRTIQSEEQAHEPRCEMGQGEVRQPPAIFPVPSSLTYPLIFFLPRCGPYHSSTAMPLARLFTTTKPTTPASDCPGSTSLFPHPTPSWVSSEKRSPTTLSCRTAHSSSSMPEP